MVTLRLTDDAAEMVLTALRAQIQFFSDMPDSALKDEQLDSWDALFETVLKQVEG